MSLEREYYDKVRTFIQRVNYRNDEPIIFF